MEENRTVITGDRTRVDWITKAAKAGPTEFGEVLLQGVMEVTRDLTDMINRQNVRDLPLIIASMHILERGLRESTIWTPETDNMIAMFEQLIGTETQTEAVAIQKKALEKIEEKKPSNADRIRAMTDEELSSFLCKDGRRGRIDVDYGGEFYTEEEATAKWNQRGEQMNPYERTVKGMLSTDYKERFRAEYQQTKLRYEKLKAFANKIDAAQMMGREEPPHDCPLDLLREQQKYMGLYLSILEKRAVIENIDLEEME